MSCLHMSYEEVKEDRGNYYVVKRVCKLCGHVLDFRTEDKPIEESKHDNV